VELLPQCKLAGDSQNEFPVTADEKVTHLRFKIYPDGGVARLRVYGEVAPDWDAIKRAGGLVDLAAVENGGLVVATSDEFFGHRHNLIMPGRAADMSDGWETKRRRGPGHDWCVIQLGAAGTIKRVEVDTAHFKGNFPESCSLEVCEAAEGRLTPAESFAEANWRELLPRTRLQAHTRHFYEQELRDAGAVTHARFRIYPDGGVSRLRLYGNLEW
jgi:allantoicase